MSNAEPIAAANLHRRSLSPVMLFTGVFVISLTLTLGLRVPTFVHHDTSEVVMWGHSGWAAGFWKHPPFLPWLSRAWSYLLPLGSFSIALLTALNMTVCAWAVWSIARLDPPTDAQASAVRRDTVGQLSLILLALVPFASVMAVKLNHNTILISLWPLTVLAFLRSLDKPTAVRGALFGLAAAAAVLAKYYSLLLLAGCFAASLSSLQGRRRYYAQPAPYTSVLMFCLAVSPHAYWMFEQSASSLGYAFHAGDGDASVSKRGWLMALLFAAQAPLLLVPASIAIWFMARAQGLDLRRRQHRHERELLLVTVVPFALTIVLVGIFNLRGAVAWAMPVFVCLPAIAAARLEGLSASLVARASMLLAVAAACLAVAGQIVSRAAVARGADGISEPRREIAEAITAAWRSAFATPLPIVAGDNRLSSAAVVFSPDHPQGWPSFSARQAPWIAPANAERLGFIGVCRPSDGGCIQLAKSAAAGRGADCTVRRRVEFLGAAGPWFEARIFIVPPRDSLAEPRCPPE